MGNPNTEEDKQPKLRLRYRQFKYHLKNDFFSTENIILVVAIFLCALWTYQSIVSMSRNWTLHEELSSIEKERDLLSLEIESMELENAYYSSAEYQEIAARKYLDKQLPGEKMVPLPANSETAKNKHVVKTVSKVQEQDISNFEKWMRFIFPQ